MEAKELLEKVAQGQIGVEAALAEWRRSLEHNLGFARVDLDRRRRCGITEVIYCPGKTTAQIIRIAQSLKNAGQNVLATRAERAVYDELVRELPEARYHDLARAITLDVAPPEPKIGRVGVVSAGTADLPVAEEAALTADRMGAHVEKLYDVGVAGIHRLLPHLDLLKSARVVIVVAGMEGALPSVVGGLIDRPIIAVPTSVGYGMNLQGVTALLAMLNSCVPGITVVNVDNGFGAGVAAAMINRIGEPT